MLNKEEIKNYLPHRDPFLFVDKVLEMECNSQIVAVKRFDQEEDFFRGHFPGNPIVPGVIMVEALAQAGGILAYASYREEIGSLDEFDVYLMGLDNVRFRKPVGPGDEVELHVEIVRKRSSVLKLRGEATVRGHIVAEADILATFVTE